MSNDDLNDLTREGLIARLRLAREHRERVESQYELIDGIQAACRRVDNPAHRAEGRFHKAARTIARVTWLHAAGADPDMDHHPAKGCTPGECYLPDVWGDLTEKLPGDSENTERVRADGAEAARLAVDLGLVKKRQGRLYPAQSAPTGLLVDPAADPADIGKPVTYSGPGTDGRPTTVTAPLAAVILTDDEVDRYGIDPSTPGLTIVRTDGTMQSNPMEEDA